MIITILPLCFKLLFNQLSQILYNRNLKLYFYIINKNKYKVEVKNKHMILMTLAIR